MCRNGLRLALLGLVAVHLRSFAVHLRPEADASHVGESSQHILCAAYFILYSVCIYTTYYIYNNIYTYIYIHASSLTLKSLHRSPSDSNSRDVSNSAPLSASHGEARLGRWRPSASPCYSPRASPASRAPRGSLPCPCSWRTRGP